MMLQVRFAEVNRRALTELGVNVLHRTERIQGLGRPLDDAAVRGAGLRHRQRQRRPEQQADVQRLPEPVLLQHASTTSARVIKALKSTGFFQSLAEPNLIAYNGQEASFLAGGEFPVPVVQGGTSNAVTVVYKEFGIRLTFKPTIAGDVIRLKVRPEVSSLDFANGITLSGFRIPALTTRRAETRRRAARRPVVRDRRPARQPDAGRRRRRSRS